MQAPPEQMYLDLMSSIRDRYDVIAKLAQLNGGNFGRAETAAFHGRKIVEGIAFGCVVATEKGLKHIPRPSATSSQGAVAATTAKVRRWSRTTYVRSTAKAFCLARSFLLAFLCLSNCARAHSGPLYRDDAQPVVAADGLRPPLNSIR